MPPCWPCCCSGAVITALGQITLGHMSYIYALQGGEAHALAATDLDHTHCGPGPEDRPGAGLAPAGLDWAVACGVALGARPRGAKEGSLMCLP
jgi:hypothetical protein